jgi:MFS family permease
MAIGSAQGRRRAGWLASTLPRGPGSFWFGVTGLVNSVGTGFFYPFQLLFFPAVMGLPLDRIGVGLTIGILAALPAVFSVGRLVDWVGARPVLVGAALLRAAVFVGYLFTHNLFVFVALAFVAAVCQRAEQVATPVLAAAIAPGDQLSRWLALAKVTFNAGIGAGGLLAAAVLAGVHDRSGYQTLGLVNAASFLVTAVLYLRLPPARPGPATRQARSGRPWQDLVFVRLVLVNFVLLTVIVGTEMALPVYLVGALGTPTWTVGLLFAVNTTVVVLCQLPVSEYVRRWPPLPAAAVGIALHACLLLALAVAVGLPWPAQLVLLGAGMLGYTLGEMAATQILAVLMVRLAPDRERGAYQAVNQVMVGLALAAAPVLATFFLSRRPAALWWVLTATVALAAADVIRMYRTSNRPEVARA